MIRLFPFAPNERAWVECDGRLLPIRENRILFELIGTTFGGDGTTNFAVPKLQGKAPLEEMRYYLSLHGVMP
jgi:microcystin-dependent protein